MIKEIIRGKETPWVDGGNIIVLLDCSCSVVFLREYNYKNVSIAAKHRQSKWASMKLKVNEIK
jgi:hypothetical protein